MVKVRLQNWADDYWMGYYNNDDAKKAGIGKPHYTNLETYKHYLEKRNQILNKL